VLIRNQGKNSPLVAVSALEGVEAVDEDGELLRLYKVATIETLARAARRSLTGFVGTGFGLERAYDSASPRSTSG
jgi:hypothetical protein